LLRAACAVSQDAVSLDCRIFAAKHPDMLPFRFLFCSVILLCWACGDRQVLMPSSRAADQWAYFPLDIGRYVVWQVDSVVYDFAAGGGTVRDSSRTWVRELVADTLRDNTGQLVYQIERSERNKLTSDWQITHIHTASRSANQAIYVEQNLRFLKLIFPMDRRSEWDGNVWIDVAREIEIAGERMRPFSNWAYEVDSIDIPARVGAFSFDSTLVVTEADDNNIIERRLSRVRYAKNVGLVEREQWILDSQYCNDTPVPIDCETKPWQDKAEKGYILRQIIIEYN
jgi:hypothetical protein